MKRENLGYIQILSAGILASFIPLLVRLGENLGPYNLTFFKIFLQAIILGLFFFFNKKKLSPLKYEKGKMFLFGAIHGFILLSYFLAIQYLTIAFAVLLMYLFPLWMMFSSHFILKEKITGNSIFALLIGLIGMIIILSPKDLLVTYNVWAILLGIFSGMGAALVYTLSKTFKKYNKASLVFWQNTIAVPFILPLLFIQLPKFTIFNSFIVLVLGLIGVAGGILVFKGFNKVQANKGGVVMLFEILLPIILALILFKEIPSITTVLGGILILIAVFVTTRINK